MKSVSILLALAVGLAFPAAAAAQPAAAMGRPLPDASLRDGMVVIRVVDGDASKPVTGADVTLVIARADGQGQPIEKTARTDPEGRATFTDVEMRMMVKAETPGAEGATISSSPFPMPETGGIRLMLSRQPVAATNAGGPPMNPRAMSGQARPEANDPKDGITVRVSYDDFADAADLSGIKVALVGYRADLAVSAQFGTTDATGRVAFTGLDRRGTTSYFAMALVPRGAGHDRLVSFPMFLTGEAGLRLMLSGEKRTSTAPPVDDLTKLDEQPAAVVPAGVVRVQVAGVPEAGTPVELVDAVTGMVVTKAPVGEPLAALDSVRASAGPVMPDPAVAAGALLVTITDGNAPLANRTLAVVAGPAGSPPIQLQTDANGVATLTGLPVGPVDLAIAVDADATARVAITKPAEGARVAVTIAGETRGEGGARMTGVPDGAERVYYVRTMMRGQPYLSAPFQLVPGRGAAITVLVMPRIMFQFSLTSWLDDVYVGVRGTFSIRNASWAPYQHGAWDKPEELVLPLPAKFVGAIVRDDFQDQVGIDPARGFVIRRPLPPGGFQFVGAFSLKVDDGVVRWKMPLPLGAFESGLEFRHAGESRLVLPRDAKNVKIEEIDDNRGRFAVLSPITILPKQSMVFELRDLPREPSWRGWGRRIAGALVLLVLVGATALALWRPRRPTARFDALLDELAALEASGDDPARRAKLMDELETLARDRERAK